MDWLRDFLKHLAISRILVAGVFITAVVMFWGPRRAPDLVPPSPAEWQPILFAVKVLAGCLLFFWGAQGVWNGIAKTFRIVRRSAAARTLSEDEVNLLYILGERPGDPLNLDNVDFQRAPFSRLELMATVSRLETKGLVRVNKFADSLVSLTKPGRERALEIQRAISASSKM